MKKPFKDYLGSLGLSIVKELLFIISIAVVDVITGLLIMLLLKEIYLGVAVFILGAILILLYTSRYKTIECGIKKDRENEFISAIPYFESNVLNGNDIYTSFSLILPCCSQHLQDAINVFLAQSEVDKTINPYICFANKFEDSSIQTLMMSIYQLSNGGDLLEFDLIYNDIKNKKSVELIESKKKSLDSFNAYPLIGAGAITVLFALHILSVIGDFINVI